MAVRRARPARGVHPGVIRLPPVAARTHDGGRQRGGGARRRGLAVHRHAAGLHRGPVCAVPRAGRHPRRAAGHGRRLDRGGRQPQPAAPGVRLHPPGGVAGRVVAHRARRPNPVVAHPPDLAVGQRPRDLAVRGRSHRAFRSGHAPRPEGRPPLRAPDRGPLSGAPGRRDAHPRRTSAAPGSPGDLPDQPVHQRVEAHVDHRSPRRGHAPDGARSSWSRGCAAGSA